MYPIRKNRNIWSQAFLKPHECNELCSAQYHIQHNSIRITYEAGCLFPERVEPLCIHVSDHDSIPFIDNVCNIPNEVKLIVDFPLKRPIELKHSFLETEIYLSTILKVFDELYTRIYQEEEEKSTKQEFLIDKACSDCNEDKYTEENIHSFLTPVDSFDQQCNICFDEGELVEIDLCKHLYHKACILKWFNTVKTDDDRKSNSCPLCRQPIIYCNTCKGTCVVQERYFGAVVPYTQEHEENRIETDGPYGIHTLYYEELYFKGLIYNRVENTLKLLPYERLDGNV